MKSKFVISTQNLRVRVCILFVEENKIAILESLENKSTREVTESLLNLSTTPQIHLRESVIPKPGGHSEVHLILDADTMKALERLKEIRSHRDPACSLSNLVKDLALSAVKKEDPVLKADRALSKIPVKIVEATPALESLTEPPTVSKISLDRSRISARVYLELDHIVPVSKGGQNSPENLRLLCRTHNARAAIETLGWKLMARHLSCSN